MPKVDAIDGLRVVVYPNDHRPAHVHVIGNGCEAVFKLNCRMDRQSCERITDFRPAIWRKSRWP